MSILNDRISLELTPPGADNHVSTSVTLQPSLRHCSELGMVDAEMERLQIFRCRNLSLIVPLYGLSESLQETEFIRGVPDLYTNAASNETYSDCLGNSSVLRRMEVQLPS